MHTWYVLVLLGLLAIQQSKAKPGLLDFLTDSCTSIKDDACAIVYDNEDCGEGGWKPLKLNGDGTTKKFSLLGEYNNDIEALVVRKGCSLQVYDKRDCFGESHTFEAQKNRDLIIRELEDGPFDDFGKS